MYLKGQYFSFDAIVGGIIFILTAMALFSYWNGVSSSLDQNHDLLAREAFRISEMLFTPLDPGLSVGWRDAHLNYSIIDGCQWAKSPQEAFGSGYLTTLTFGEVDVEGNVRHVCVWGTDEKDIDSQNIYRMRRPASYLHRDGTTSLGYVDILVYEAPRTE